MEDSLIRIAYVEMSRKAKRVENNDYGAKPVEFSIPEKKYGMINPDHVVYVTKADDVTVKELRFPAVNVCVSAGQSWNHFRMLEEDFYDVFGYTEGTIGIDKDFHGMVSEAVGEAEV